MEKENKKLTVLVVILLIIVVGLGGYITYDKLSSKHNDLEPIENKSTTKLDDSKDYIYDADYTELYNNKHTEYTSGNATKKLSDLNVPYINIDSYDARNANDELKALYRNRAETFDKCAVDSHDCYDSITYKTYKYDDVLSVVVIYDEALTKEYKTYNFDLKTGNEITYDELITRLGYDKSTLLDKEKEVIKKAMDESNNFNYDLTKTCGTMESPKNCYDIAYKILEDSIKDKSMAYFTDTNGKLNIVAVPYTNLAQNSYYAKYVFTIEK